MVLKTFIISKISPTKRIGKTDAMGIVSGMIDPSLIKYQ